MGIRVTVVLDKINMEKLRLVQSKLIRKSTRSVSFSEVLNQIVEQGLKTYKH